MLYIKKAKKYGRGVFTNTPIERGDLIERCPVIVLARKDSDVLDTTALYDYYYEWHAARKEIAIGLGFASLYNHSYQPSAEYYLRHRQMSIDFVAIRDIAPGQQIFVNYNGEPDDGSPLWCQDRITWS